LMSRSVRQAVENEASFRRANEGLEEKADEIGLGDERTPCLCECEDERCRRIISLRREEYEAVRGHPKRFVLVPGHHEADGLVPRAAHSLGREKGGKGGAPAPPRDPRPP